VPLVLLIDDFEPFRASLRDALARIGLGIVEAEDRDTAERALRDRTYDLILTDLTMPGAEGTDVLDMIEQWQPETPVVVISGSLAKADATVRQPVDAWLEKPCSIKALRATVIEALGTPATTNGSHGEADS